MDWSWPPGGSLPDRGHDERINLCLGDLSVRFPVTQPLRHSDPAIGSQLINIANGQTGHTHDYRQDMEMHWQRGEFASHTTELDEQHFTGERQKYHQPENTVTADSHQWIFLFFGQNSGVYEIEQLQKHKHMEEERIVLTVLKSPSLFFLAPQKLPRLGLRKAPQGNME